MAFPEPWQVLKKTSQTMKFTFGLEHEVAFRTAQGDFADFSNTSFALTAGLTL